MRCPLCGEHELVTDCKDIPYQYKGRSIMINNVQGDFCLACEEYVLSHEESERVSAAMLAFNKTVNQQMIDPAFITKVRKKLNLDQHEAAKYFGGGVNAFSRYETGKTKPPLALIQLLRLLDTHPELLPEIQTGENAHLGV